MGKKFDYWAFSSDIRHKRVVEKRIKQRECAAEIGISTPTLCRAENGYAIDLNTYFYLCEWLGKPMETYFKPIEP